MHLLESVCFVSEIRQIESSVSECTSFSIVGTSSVTSSITAQHALSSLAKSVAEIASVSPECNITFREKRNE